MPQSLKSEWQLVINYFSLSVEKSLKLNQLSIKLAGNFSLTEFYFRYL